MWGRLSRFFFEPGGPSARSSPQWVVMIINMNASVWISISGLGLYLAVWGYAQWQHRAAKRINQMKRATGSCIVSFEPEGSGTAMISEEKEFHGALEGSSKREVLPIADHDAG